MQSRRDHVQAYQFVTSRLASALTTGETGTGEAPLRRSSLGVMWGLVIALLLCGGFAVYGLISPGGATDWKQPGSIIVEKETGNRYLYINGTLYPTLNTASAMLYFGGSNVPAVFRPVSRNSLAGVPHGPSVGIPGAPDAVPTNKDLLSPSWALCADPGATSPTMTIDLDPNTPAQPMPDDERFRVTGPDGAEYVVWRDTLYPIASHAALVALGLGDVTPTRVPTSWLHALAPGPVLTAPDIPGAGAPGPSVAGVSTRVGQLLTTTIGGQTQNYVLREDGVAPVNATALALLSAMPGAGTPRQIPASAMAALPVSADTSMLQGVPDLVAAPTYRGGQSAVCVRQVASGDLVSPGHLATERLDMPLGQTTLSVPPGKGMIAQVSPVAVAGQPTYFLITDVGEKFQLSQQAPGALQLGGPVVSMPAELLSAMPSGPTLVTGMPALLAGRGGGQ